MSPEALPAEIGALADWRWGEPGFRRAVLPDVAAAAAAHGLAARGGQVQVRTPDQTFELFWTDYDPTPRREGEPWGDWAGRSWKELLFLAADLPGEDRLAVEAIARFDELAGTDPAAVAAGLWFVIYFDPAGRDAGG